MGKSPPLRDRAASPLYYPGAGPVLPAACRVGANPARNAAPAETLMRGAAPLRPAARAPFAASCFNEENETRAGCGGSQRCGVPRAASVPPRVPWGRDAHGHRGRVSTPTGSSPQAGCGLWGVGVPRSLSPFPPLRCSVPGVTQPLCPRSRPFVWRVPGVAAGGFAPHHPDQLSWFGAEFPPLSRR